MNKTYIGKPHYQSLKFNRDIPDTFSYVGNLYSQKLQDDLLGYETEKEKMPVTVNWICNNAGDSLINNGGRIEISVGMCPDTRDIKMKFSTLKSLSIYTKYLFDTLTGDDILGVYGELYYKLEEGIKEVKTYTIVYEITNGIREVTLHDFHEYGAILTTCDLGINL